MLRLRIVLAVVFVFSSHAYGFETVSSFEKSESAFKVLLFLSKDFPCSRSHADHLNQLQAQFPTVGFYGVIADEVRDTNEQYIKEYFSKEQFRFPVIEDRQQVLIKQYDALKTPHVVLLQKQPNGQYTRMYEGGVTNHREFKNAKKYFLQNILAATIDHKPLPYANGKSLGCYIRRL